MKKILKPYVFLFPAFIILAIFSYWPIFNAFRLSLYHTNGLGYSEFVGLANFVELFSDPLFYLSLKILGFFLLSLPLLISCPLISARILHQIKNNFASYVYRVLFVIPVVVPLLIKFLIWKFII